MTDVLAAPSAELEQLRERTRQLQQALTSRVAVDTAVGVLLERHRLGRQDAFELLRRAARHHRRSIHELAREVTARHEDTPEIAAILALDPR